MATHWTRTAERSTPEEARPVVNFVGERVALGPLSRELVPLYHRWRNDFYVMRTFGDVPRPVTLEARQTWFERQTAIDDDDALWFTIYEVATWRPIGTTDLFGIDQRHRSASFGMMIGEADCRGKGYGTETARLMLDYAFTALGLHSVRLDVDEFNLAGRRAYAKAGYREVGRLREATWLAGRWWDLIVMDCLAAEFVTPVLGAIFAPDREHGRPEATGATAEPEGSGPASAGGATTGER